MSESYVQLWSSLLDSTVWHEALPVKVCWVTMLVMADASGYVGASVPGLAARAGITIPQAEEALNKFLAPDPFSRSKEHEGRRIAVAERGWIVLNYEKHRFPAGIIHRRERVREAMRRYRKRLKDAREAAQAAARKPLSLVEPLSDNVTPTLAPASASTSGTVLDPDAVPDVRAPKKPRASSKPRARDREPEPPTRAAASTGDALDRDALSRNEQKPKGTEPAELDGNDVHAFAVRLAGAANGAVTRRWQESTTPYRGGQSSTFTLASELLGQGIPVTFAEASIVRRMEKLATPPRSLGYFKAMIVEDWDAERSKPKAPAIDFAARDAAAERQRALLAFEREKLEGQFLAKTAERARSFGGEPNPADDEAAVRSLHISDLRRWHGLPWDHPDDSIVAEFEKHAAELQPA